MNIRQAFGWRRTPVGELNAFVQSLHLEQRPDCFKSDQSVRWLEHEVQESSTTPGHEFGSRK